MLALRNVANEWPGCRSPGCVGPPAAYNTKYCERHQDDRAAPPMLIVCECDRADVERLRAFGADAAQCRRCGSPIRGTVPST